MKKHFRMAALAATAALGVAPMPLTQAAAQGYPGYCNGQMRGVQFYSTSETVNNVTTFTYWVTLQNLTNGNVTYAVGFEDWGVANRATGTQYATASRAAMELRTRLGTQTGGRAMTSASTQQYTRVYCRAA